MKAIKLPLLIISILSIAFATQAADISGKYKGKMERSNGESIEIVMELKQEGSKVTGKAIGPTGEVELHDGKIEGDKLTYLIKFDRDGETVSIKNNVKVAGDTLHGKSELPRPDGEVVTREWMMKKERGAQFSGKWKTTIARQDGGTFELNYNLKQDGNKLTGTSSFNNGDETEISEGKVTGNEVSFVVKRERNGRTFTSKYSGKLDGNKIVGKSESDFGGQTRSRDWEAIKQ